MVKMTDNNTFPHFKKSPRASKKFFRHVWHFDRKYIDTIDVYHGYFRKQVPVYINDFANHSSFLSTNLSPDKIRSIHETNAEMAYCCGSASKGSGHQHNDAVRNSLQGNNSSSARLERSRNRGIDDQSTVHLTGAFLDRFQIPPGQAKTRREVYEMKSNLFFHCLSFEIGTLRLVKLRQTLYLENLENIFNIENPGFTIHLIGSKSEGLDFEGSDTDTLAVCNFAHETRFKDDIHLCSHLRYCSVEKGVYPGYVLLRRRSGEIIRSSDIANIVQQEILRPSSIFRVSNHGPAIMQSKRSSDTDTVTSIGSHDWPERAHGWITRKRNFGWPSEEMITNITRKGCHIVPVGTKRNNILVDTEWRLSFCIAERELVWTFNQPQILIYGLLKIVLKEIINPNCHRKDLICSYFLKTVMFWVIEESDPSIWSSRNMLFLFHLSFNRLVQCVVENNCPNCFIPSNNMFKDRFENDSRAELLHILLYINDSGMTWMYRSKSLRPFADLFCINVPCNRLDIYSIRLKSIRNGIIGSYQLVYDLVFQYQIKLSFFHHQNRKHSKMCLNQ